MVGRKSAYSLYDYALATYDKDDSFDHAAAKGFIQLQTLSAKTWASNRRQEGAPAELFDAQKKVGPLTKGAYEDVTPVWKQVAEAENAAVVEEAEAALQALPRRLKGTLWLCGRADSPRT
mgnify:FL=1